MTVMLLTKELLAVPTGGRELLCQLNHDVLKDLYADDFSVFELGRGPRRGLRSMVGALAGEIDGLEPGSLDRLVEAVDRWGVRKLFIDGSNLGAAAKVIKRRRPSVEVTTFFHNVEARFFFGAWREARSARALAVMAANYVAERKAVRHSDKIVCLSQRDSGVLGQLYGRTATHVSPMALRDQLGEAQQASGAEGEGYALFVGGSFYANRSGMRWFAENVAPQIRMKTYVVGRGFEELRTEFERNAQVRVVGAVESLGAWYRNAQFVIAPIFDGSGMKTKVAEALMHGKRVVGTPEAFSGYEDVAGQVGWSCATAAEFASAIARAQVETTSGFDPSLRALYERHYSFPAAKRRFADILGPA